MPAAWARRLGQGAGAVGQWGRGHNEWGRRTEGAVGHDEWVGVAGSRPARKPDANPHARKLKV